MEQRTGKPPLVFRIRPLACFEASQVERPSFWENLVSEVQENQALRLELDEN